MLDDPAFDLDDVNGSCEKIISAYHCDNLDYKYFIEIKEVMDFVIGNTDHGKSRQCWNFFREPIIITVSDEEKYYINLIRETKQFKLTNSFNDQEVIEDSLESMVQYIMDNHLL